MNTLVLVHREQLRDQSQERLTFLDLSPKSIGHIGGGKEAEPVASLYQKNQVRDFVAGYGQIIVDECHHICDRAEGLYTPPSNRRTSIATSVSEAPLKPMGGG